MVIVEFKARLWKIVLIRQDRNTAMIPYGPIFLKHYDIIKHWVGQLTLSYSQFFPDEIQLFKNKGWLELSLKLYIFKIKI